VKGKTYGTIEGKNFLFYSRRRRWARKDPAAGGRENAAAKAAGRVPLKVLQEERKGVSLHSKRAAERKGQLKMVG